VGRLKWTLTFRDRARIDLSSSPIRSDLVLKVAWQLGHRFCGLENARYSQNSPVETLVAEHGRVWDCHLPNGNADRSQMEALRFD